jgi:uncharacterized membrane protein
MKSAIEFVQTTALGGLLVVLPILILTLLLSEALDLVAAISEPIAAAFPVEEVGGVEIALLLGILIILLLCFLTGLIAATRIGSSISDIIERGFLDRVPGYKLIKGLTSSYAQVTSGSQFSVASVDLYGDGTRVLGFVVDEVEGESGDFTIYVPNAPTLASGSVYFVARERVTLLAVPMGDLASTHMQWGIGSAELLRQPLETAPR